MLKEQNKSKPLCQHKKSPSKLSLVSFKEQQNQINKLQQYTSQSLERTTQPIFLYIISLISQIYTTIQVAILLEPFKLSNGFYQFSREIIIITSITRIIIFLINSVYMGGFRGVLHSYTILDIGGILSICVAIAFILLEIIVTSSYHSIFSLLSIFSYMLTFLCYISYVGNFRLMMIKCQWGKSKVIVMKLFLYLFCLFYLGYYIYFSRNTIKLEQHCTLCTPMNSQCQSLCLNTSDCCFNHQTLFIKSINDINQYIMVFIFINLGYLSFIISFMSKFDGVSDMKVHYQLGKYDDEEQNLMRSQKNKINSQKDKKQQKNVLENNFQYDLKIKSQKKQNRRQIQFKLQNQSQNSKRQVNFQQQCVQKQNNKNINQKLMSQQYQQLWKRKKQPFLLFTLCNLCELYTGIQIYVFFSNTMDPYLQWKYVWSTLIITGAFRIIVWCINSIYMAGIRGTFYGFIMADILGVLTVCQASIFIGFQLVIGIPTKQIKFPLPTISYVIIFFVYVVLVGNFRIMMKTSIWGKYQVLTYKFKLYLCCLFYIMYGLYYIYNKDNSSITSCSIECNPYSPNCQPSCTMIDGSSTPCCLDLENLMILGYNRVNQFFVLFLATGLALFSQLVSYMSQHDGVHFMNTHFTLGIQKTQQGLETPKYIKQKEKRISLQNNIIGSKMQGINQIECTGSNLNRMNFRNLIVND